jgi:hypothetical protein
MTKTNIFCLIGPLLFSSAYPSSIERTLVLNLLKGESVEEVKRIVGQPDRESMYTAKIVNGIWTREWLDYSRAEGNSIGYGPVAYFENGRLVDVRGDFK